ncbi:MAG: TrbI/VirB10 family protein [Alphaproteobacteria bacterium]|jgi:type IV secretory pathway VirB10-like protein|nr:TrbI/VirB10 family protein [Alphaproteobacteria bacterium]
MYSLAKVIIIMIFSITLHAESYKGHYQVVQPKHVIDFEAELEKQKNNKSIKNELYDENGNLITNKNKKKNTELSNKDKENMKLKNQLADYEKQLKRERETNLLAIRQQEDLEQERKRREEERKKSINARRQNTMFGIISKSNTNDMQVKKDTEYDLEKNISTLPVDRTRIITNDRYIVGLLENTIDTQLGGRAVIVVEDNIFGADNRKILLPKGSRMVCNYSPLDEPGQTRVGIECTRILRPDGASITLTNAYVGDQMGATGAVGKVDNRNREKYSNALALSALSGLNAYGSFMLALSDNPNYIAMSPVLQDTGRSLSDVTTKILDKTLNLPPIVKIAKGSRVTLMPQTDIYLKAVDSNPTIEEEK